MHNTFQHILNKYSPGDLIQFDEWGAGKNNYIITQIDKNNQGFYALGKEYKFFTLWEEYAITILHKKETHND